MSDLPLLRVARPVRDLRASVRFYVEVMAWARLGGFEDHAGYHGAFVGPRGAGWHLELTWREAEQPPALHDEDLLVVYLEQEALDALGRRRRAHGVPVEVHPNPYWAQVGAHVFRDPDGYLIVACPPRGPVRE